MSADAGMLQQVLEYTPDSSALFGRVASEDWAIWLDSGKPAGSYGRYDIIVARPFITVTTRHGETTVRRAEHSEHHGRRDPFAVLQEVLARYPSPSGDLPFCGGAVGYFGYDLARSLETLPDLAHDAEDMPEMCVGIYDWAVIVDHREQKTRLLSFGRDAATRGHWEALRRLFCAPPPRAGSAPFAVTSRVCSNLDEAAYARRFEQIKRYIAAGDCYQVNLAQRFCAQASGDGWDAYQQLRRISPAPFMAFMRLPGCQVLSASPERFLQVSGDYVETRPIKGTRPRSDDPATDRANAAALQASLKDRAENLMIVDLLRNDLGKNCAVGSVRADRLFALESFANVHHLVSTVSGRLAPGKSALDLLRGCFPGGSITGAPKLRAMEIIEALEPHRRGLYCGAIGYVGFDGNMDSNIAIRTAVYSRNEIRFWAGGGIVADSELRQEYRETWDKASHMLQLLQHFSAVADDA